MGIRGHQPQPPPVRTLLCNTGMSLTKHETHINQSYFCHMTRRNYKDYMLRTLLSPAVTTIPSTIIHLLKKVTSESYKEERILSVSKSHGF